MSLATKGEVRAWLVEFIMCETQAMGMNLSQLGNVFEVEKSKKLDHKALGFHFVPSCSSSHLLNF
jgi:hypothetical protein